MSICVVGGLGYVGLVTSACLAELGHTVTAVDVDTERLARVRAGRMPFHEPGLAELVARGLAAGRLRLASTLREGMRDARIVFVAVATPARPDGETDLSQVIAAAEELAPLLARRTIIAIKSTVPLGTRQAVQRVLDAAGRVAGRDYDLVAVPEFLREGQAVYDFLHPTRIVIGGADPAVRAEIRQLFVRLNAPVLETTFPQALLIKYASNAFLATRVSFANELAGLCDAAGVDVAEVVRGMGYDPRIGHGYLAPGIGFGGPCLEKDLRSLIRVAENAGYEPAFLRAVLEKNDHQIRQIVRRTSQALDFDLYHRTIAVLGLAFKPGTSDVRNSLAVRILFRLMRQGAVIRAHDPLANQEARDVFDGLAVFDDPYEAATGSDLVLLLNACEEFRRLDLERLHAVVAAPNMVDGVNVIDPAAARQAGFVYQGVGRR
ncbi:MAG: UDP-glucose/GDP-mannose dehydrogenase family protein [Armatimonadota bacterium]|nr:UDP-glucose/GDP-mannose dehydrogenase family protein [Armatimonadota bacterium]